MWDRLSLVLWISAFSANAFGSTWIHIHPSDQSRLQANQFLSSLKFPTPKKQIFITTERAEAPEWSTGDIVKAIKESAPPIVILAKDKSATDALDALLRFPKLAEKVTHFVSIDAPIGGVTEAKKYTEPVDFYLSNRADSLSISEKFFLIKKIILSFFHPITPAGELALRRQVRQAYLVQWEKEIQALVNSKVVYSLSSTNNDLEVIPGAQMITFPLTSSCCLNK
jgi:hypothetical protein